jgi:hypothetical protein
MSEQRRLYRIRCRDVYIRFDEMMVARAAVSLEQSRRALHTQSASRSHADICEVMGIWRLSGRILRDLKQAHLFALDDRCL